MLDVTDTVQERDGWMDGVYLGLKKAFDKVSYRRLLWKLESIGGLIGLLRWMEDFLKNKEMKTIISDVRSWWRKVISRVPQGSVLGPVMLFIYSNNMTEGVNCYISLFAENAKLLKWVNSEEDCVTTRPGQDMGVEL